MESRHYARRGKGNKIPKGVAVGPGKADVTKKEMTVNFMGKYALQDREKDCMERCVRTLQHAIDKGLSDRGLRPEWSVEKFGSSANGFGTAGADLDVTIVRKRQQRYCEEELDAAAAAQELQDILQPLLQGHRRFAVVQEIYGAKVPICKLRFEHCLEVDVSCHNLRALRNTRLLNAYSEMSPSLHELVVAVKIWAKAHGVCGAAERNLSSYALTLMAIYFLQLELQIQLPCLPVDAFELGKLGRGDRRVAKLQNTWKDPRPPVQALLVGFFQFYISNFAWGSEVVSVRLGRRSSVDSSDFEALSHRWTQRLHIEDPYELGRNLHCVLAAEREMCLMSAMHDSLCAVQIGLAPRGFEDLLRMPNSPGSTRWPSPATSVATSLASPPSSDASTSPVFAPTGQEGPELGNAQGMSALSLDEEQQKDSTLTEARLLSILHAQLAPGAEALTDSAEAQSAGAVEMCGPHDEAHTPQNGEEVQRKPAPRAALKAEARHRIHSTREKAPTSNSMQRSKV